MTQAASSLENHFLPSIWVLHHSITGKWADCKQALCNVSHIHETYFECPSAKQPKNILKRKNALNLKCDWTNILFFILEITRSNFFTTSEAGWVTAQRCQWVASLVHNNWKPHLPHSHLLFSLKGFLLVWSFSDQLKNEMEGCQDGSDLKSYRPSLPYRVELLIWAQTSSGSKTWDLIRVI